MRVQTAPIRESTPRILDYSMALRNIGQDFERSGLKSFDIRFDGKEFPRLCGYQAPPAATPVSNRSTLPRDIEELDEAGENRRGKTAPPKDFLNQPQFFAPSANISIGMRRSWSGYQQSTRGARIPRLSSNTSAVTANLRRRRPRRRGDLRHVCAMYKQRGRVDRNRRSALLDSACKSLQQSKGFPIFGSGITS